MDIISTMFVSSNSLFLLIILIEYLKKDLFSQCLQYALLKIAVFFSVFPIVMIKFALQSVMDEFYPAGNQIFNKIEGKFPLIVKTPEALHMNLAFKIRYVIFLLWFCVVLLIAVRYLIVLVKFRKSVFDSTSENVPENILRIARQQCTEFGLWRKVDFRVAKTEISPFTLGIFKPIIVIPEINDLEKQKILITHELYHIKRWDGLIKLIGMISKTLYWFNPLVHKLYARLDMAIENSCDELVKKNMDKEERKKYAFLIFDMAELNSDYPASLTISLSNNKEKLKERGRLIMRNTKKTSNYAFFLALGLVVVSSFPIFASERAQVLSFSRESIEYSFPENSGDFLIFFADDEEKSFQQILYPVQFVDRDGNIYNVDSLHSRNGCQNHDYVEGQLMVHKKNKDGGCIVKYYDGKRCSKCGNVVYERLIDIEYYETCPH